MAGRNSDVDAHTVVSEQSEKNRVEVSRKTSSKSFSMEEPLSPASQAPSRPPMINCKICIALVGLPARGKTYISKKLSRYLRWIGLDTKVFNVGEYRRRAVGANKSHDFFRADNIDALKLRMECAKKALKDLKDFLTVENGQAAIYDATNSTVERRQLILNYLKGDEHIQVFFIESICDDQSIIDTNIKTVKLTSPDYVGMDPEDAVEDFLQRIKNYESAYETLDISRDRDLSWVKIFNVDQRYEANRITGHLQAKLVYYLLNIHTLPRHIYLCRHGESICNLFGKIGGDSELSERGLEFAKALKTFMDDQKMVGFNVWTSQLKRTIQTAQYLTGTIEQFKALNELDVGECEAMTYEAIQEKYPKEFALRDQDKYHYRYPKGESYEDVVQRLEPVIMELERKRKKASGKGKTFEFSKGIHDDVVYSQVTSIDLQKVAVTEEAPKRKQEEDLDKLDNPGDPTRREFEDISDTTPLLQDEGESVFVPFIIHNNDPFLKYYFNSGP